MNAFFVRPVYFLFSSSSSIDFLSFNCFQSNCKCGKYWYNDTHFFIVCHVCRLEPLIAGNSDTATLLNFSLTSLIDFVAGSDSVFESDFCDETTINSYVDVCSVVCSRCCCCCCPLFNCIRKLFLAEVKRLSLYSSQSLVHSKYGSAVGKSIGER